MEKKKIKFTKDTTLSEIIDKKGVRKVLENYNFPCLHCPMARMEDLRLEEICNMYGIDLNKLLKDLNKI